MANTGTLFGKVAAGFAAGSRNPGEATGRSGRRATRQASGRNGTASCRSPLSLAGNSHMLGVASLYPLRHDLADGFQPTHLADSTDLPIPSFDIRGPIAVAGVEAHLTFTVEKAADGSWRLFQNTPTAVYPGSPVEDPAVIRQIAAATLQSVTQQRLRAGLPWEPGVLTAGSRVIEALRELCQ